jgi:hypothetical protein
MLTLGLDYEEFQQVLHLCRLAGMAGGPSGFSLRRFLVSRLRATLPETAAKIDGLSGEELDRLCQEIQARPACPVPVVGAVRSGPVHPWCYSATAPR